MIIEGLAAAITPEMVPMLQSFIPEKLWPIISARLNEAQKKQREAKEAESKLAVYKGDAGDAVAGGGLQ